MPFTAGNARKVFDKFFACLGVVPPPPSYADHDEEPVIERENCELLASCLGVDVDACDSTVARAEFRQSMTSVCDSEADMVTQMSDFLATVDGCRDDGADGKNASPKKFGADIARGVWAYKCVFPVVIEQWTKVWLTVRDGRLQWHLGNHQQPQGNVPLAQVVDAKLASMLPTKAPKYFAKNGVRLRLTSGANPVYLALCTESMTLAHDVLAAVRAGSEQLSATAGRSASPLSQRSASVQSAVSPKRPAAAAGSTVWTMRSGQTKWAQTKWVVSGNLVVHSADNGVRGNFEIGGIREISTAANFAAMSPPVRGSAKLCSFVLSFADCDLLCCADRPQTRETLLAQIKTTMLKERLMRDHGKGVPASPTTRSASAAVVDGSSAQRKCLPGATPVARAKRPSDYMSPSSRSPSYTVTPEFR
jgi:hypothetical protein